MICSVPGQVEEYLERTEFSVVFPVLPRVEILTLHFDARTWVYDACCRYMLLVVFTVIDPELVFRKRTSFKMVKWWNEEFEHFVVGWKSEDEKCDHSKPCGKIRNLKKMEMFPFLLTCIFLPLIRGHSLFTCEPITVPRCMKMAYNMTFFPNLMGHYDQSTAAVEMEVSCSSYPYRKIIYVLFWNNV